MANQPLFAVSLKLCFIGTSDFESALEKSKKSGICMNGTGNYFGSTLIGDVYRIVKEEEFQESAVNIRYCGINYCMDDDGSCNIHSGSSDIRQISGFGILVILLILYLHV